MKSFVVAVGLVASGAGQALAADPMAVAPVADYSWTGGYVGVVGGINRLLGDTNIPNYDPSGYNADSTSASIGGQVGYQYQFPNNFVLGAEARLVAVFNKGSDPTSSTESVAAGANYQGDVVVKAGYAMGRFLPYVKGGAAFIHLNNVGYQEPGGGGVNDLSHGYAGWTIGAGFDYALNDKWIAGFDYAYADFGHHDFADDSSALGPTIVSPSTHTVSISLNYKF